VISLRQASIPHVVDCFCTFFKHKVDIYVHTLVLLLLRLAELLLLLCRADVCVLCCSYRTCERTRSQHLQTLHRYPCSQPAHRKVLSFVTRRGLSLTSIMPTTFLTLVRLARQPRQHTLSGLLERISTVLPLILCSE